MDALFYVRYNGKTKGPFTLPQIRHFVKTNQITPETPILVSGSAEWRRAVDVEGVFIMELANKTKESSQEQKTSEPGPNKPFFSSMLSMNTETTGNNPSSSPVKESEHPKKERTQAIVLAIFLGWCFGVHRFYLGKDSAFQVAVPLVGFVVWFVFFTRFFKEQDSTFAFTVVTILCIMLTFGVMEAFSIADAIKLLLMTDEKFDELYN